MSAPLRVFMRIPQRAASLETQPSPPDVCLLCLYSPALVGCTLCPDVRKSTWVGSGQEGALVLGQEAAAERLEHAEVSWGNHARNKWCSQMQSSLLLQHMRTCWQCLFKHFYCRYTLDPRYSSQPFFVPISSLISRRQIDNKQHFSQYVHWSASTGYSGSCWQVTF